jgi:hypothetical protein
MTRTEFLAELSLIRDHFDWQLSPQSEDGGYSGRVRKHIRAVPKEAPQVVLDPLGALCYINHNLAVKPNDWARAGEILGLAAPGEVAAAANDQTWAGTGPRREPVVYLQRLRRRLESAVGLV